MAESPFVDDAGPGFDAEAAAAGAQEVRSAEEAEARELGMSAFELPPIDEDKVRHVLFVAGDGIHAVAGVGDYDWVMTQRDLERIAPPLTRILNRYDAAKTIAQYSDEAALLVGFGLYTWRSLLERIAVLRAQENGQAPPVPAPPPGPGPARAPAPPPPPPEQAAPAWPTNVPSPPQAASAPPPAQAPAPASVSPPAGVGAEHFPGAGAPQEPGAASVEIVPGYVTRAERIRQARERSPDAVPAQAPGTTF